MTALAACHITLFPWPGKHDLLRFIINTSTCQRNAVNCSASTLYYRRKHLPVYNLQGGNLSYPVNGALICMMLEGQVIRATFPCNLWRDIVCASCKALLPVLPPPQATSRFLAKSRTEFYFVNICMLLQLATLKFIAR